MSSKETIKNNDERYSIAEIYCELKKLKREGMIESDKDTLINTVKIRLSHNHRRRVIKYMRDLLSRIYLTLSKH